MIRAVGKLKLAGWYLLHDWPHFRDVTLRKLRMLTLHRSQYYQDCVNFYSCLDVGGKRVMDMGCDYGTTPLYFLSRGAKFVYGVSMDDQYFKHDHYVHHRALLSGNFLSELEDKRAFLKLDTLKSDIEGMEWDYTPEFVSKFDDWVIALHTPIRNEALYNWIKEQGYMIGKQEGNEFAIYKRGVRTR